MTKLFMISMKNIVVIYQTVMNILNTSMKYSRDYTATLTMLL